MAGENAIDTRAVPPGWVCPNDQTGCVPLGAAIVTPEPSAAGVGAIVGEGQGPGVGGVPVDALHPGRLGGEAAGRGQVEPAGGRARHGESGEGLLEPGVGVPRPPAPGPRPRAAVRLRPEGLRAVRSHGGVLVP